MAAELDFSPPEIPEPTFMENVLRYGLFFGAIFQLICVLAIILPVSKSHKTETSWIPEDSLLGQDSDSFEPKTSETVKKPKATAPQISKKPKKETKKKR
ncbi:protein MANBAL isoform X1 [Anser cygnoides]|uniref:protein MANBAL isoform X1 n=1 Tax=Anser cygnoides TaxID=8845 RepID=UPI0020091BC7|nr:protein MANBAL isoform X2 [Anser cygnoides]XP_047902376.1 protein MANBAL isoform X2 [Anser cygnoides]XP_047902377.1 protein MANBAL isoform X2 [Anser cygnoides]XP_047902378.1 protein MANBAL isoform X2 [Anser cygnoides]XP_047902379.1 protein MANBAL isoform X2 [Anser cygnoides]XP_047902380.1 protein MANBAL isoform X2 [Anser cygnoides]XP_047902381.1 protein MANBAL isoform X2 [Anser cygnoides]XP_047902382.1 protein MANBAL isoform X2 [Anser cygnoides]XP_047902383.1 protein MANBAL isoform X2 [A